MNRKLSWPLPRGEYRENRNGRYHPRRLDQLKKLNVVNGIPVLYGTQDLTGGKILERFADGKPAVVREGNVILLGFYPGLGYVASGKHPGSVVAGKTSFFSCTDYAADARNLIRKLLDNRLTLAASSNQPLVEVNLLKGGDKYLLVLANWSGKRQKTILTLSFPVKKAVSVGNRVLNVKTDNGKSSFVTELDAGDIIELSCR